MTFGNELQRINQAVRQSFPQSCVVVVYQTNMVGAAHAFPEISFLAR